ncbi:MAG: uracil-DNA glycosylase [Blastochloris sp.]|nr:uracil-DNA glycosylase [Blastochloris sp.]
MAATVNGCVLCVLYKGRTKAVPGAGSPNTPILFIGEGPGFHEDRQGLPFVGKSGDYLEKLLAMIGLHRNQVFITNVVKCRPPENRDPLPDEIAACKPYLDRQIELIDPLVIVTLGRYSMARYFPGGKITQIHGKPKYDAHRAYIPLFHPAAVLRNPALEVQMEADFKHIPVLVTEMRKRRAAAPAPTPATPTTPTIPNDDDPPMKQLPLF